jgi:hypothetical protein
MSTKPSETADLIYQLKITLRDSHPPIWRRVLTPGKFNLYKLHQVIQIAMGWTDSHLHHFLVGGIHYSPPHPNNILAELGEKDSRRVTLAQIAPDPKCKFFYEYDFGDSWDHEILVEKIQSPESDIKYPLCIKGKRACPPEDVGGVWGYMEFVEAMSNPDHDEHDSYFEWWGGEYDPEEFDIEAVNQALHRVK